MAYFITATVTKLERKVLDAKSVAEATEKMKFKFLGDVAIERMVEIECDKCGNSVSLHEDIWQCAECGALSWNECRTKT